jgi:hypothetical protein
VKFVTNCWSFEHFLKGKKFVKGVCLVKVFEKDLSLVKGLSFFVVFCFVVG